jgi:hypothetical protein
VRKTVLLLISLKTSLGAASTLNMRDHTLVGCGSSGGSSEGLGAEVSCSI